MDKKLKITKTRRLVYNIVISLLIVCSILFIVFVPDGFMVYTGIYGTGSKEENEFIDKVMGENAEENYKLYFYWYNVMHESAHGVIWFNGNKEFTYAENEMLANKFAVAYWKKYGEEDKVKKLEEIVDYALSNLTNPAKDGQTITEWLNENYKTQAGNQSFNDYGYFQFKSVKEAFESTDSLEDVVKEMTDKKVVLNDKKLSYKTIDKDSSTQVIFDASDNFREWGLNFPEHDMINHYYLNQPSNHFSTTMRNISEGLIPKIIVFFILQMVVVNFIFYKSIKKLSNKK